MANDTQNSPEVATSRSYLFGVPVVIDPDMPEDRFAIVSHTWDHAKGRLVELDRVNVFNVG